MGTVLTCVCSCCRGRCKCRIEWLAGEVNDGDNALILSFDFEFAEELDIFLVEGRVRFVHMLV